MSIISTDNKETLGSFGALVDGVDFLQTEPPEVKWLAWGLIPVGGVAALVGQTNALKSWLALKLAVCVATGLPLGTFVTCGAGKVLYIDKENGRGRLHRRLRALFPSGLSLERGRLRFACFPPVSLVDGAEFEEAFEQDVRVHGSPSLVIVDTFRAASPGIEENSSAIREILDSLKSLAERHQTTFVVVHHKGKSSSSPLHSPRGSSAFTDALDALLTVDRPSIAKKEAIIQLAKDRDGGDQRSFIFSLEDSENMGTFELVPTGGSSQGDELEKLVLQQVCDNPGTSQKKVRDALGRRHEEVVRVLGHLEEKGLVRRPSERGGYFPAGKEKNAQ